eukprot:1541050-Rhodomonas_salina.3
MKTQQIGWQEARGDTALGVVGGVDEAGAPLGLGPAAARLLQQRRHILPHHPHLRNPQMLDCIHVYIHHDITSLDDINVGGETCSCCNSVSTSYRTIPISETHKCSIAYMCVCVYIHHIRYIA